MSDYREVTDEELVEFVEALNIEDKPQGLFETLASRFVSLVRYKTAAEKKE